MLAWWRGRGWFDNMLIFWSKCAHIWALYRGNVKLEQWFVRSRGSPNSEFFFLVYGGCRIRQSRDLSLELFFLQNV